MSAGVQRIAAFADGNPAEVWLGETLPSAIPPERGSGVRVSGRARMLEA